MRIRPIFLLNTIFCFLAFGAFAQVADEKTEYPFFTPEDERNEICHARCLTQSVYDTIPEKVLESPQSSRIEIVEPKFDTIEEKIEIHPEYRVVEVVPAIFDTVEYEVTVYEEYQYYAYDDAPTVYKDDCFSVLKERVTVGPAESKWRVERKPDCKSKNWDDCVFLILQDMPEEIQTEEVRVNDCPPPSPLSKTVVAKTEKIKKVVLRQPAQIKETVIPAKSKIIKRVVISQYASTTLVEIPSKYKTINKLIINTPGGKTEFMPVLCATEAEKLLPQIQKKLKELEYYKGKNDGKLSDKFKDAMITFQLDHGLPIGQFDYFSMKKLGIKTKKG